MSKQNDHTMITYNGQKILVPNEVAEFLELDRKKMAAQQRSDRRHYICNDPEDILGIQMRTGSPVLYQVIKNLTIEKLHKAIVELDADEKQLIEYRYYDEMTLQQIGCKLGVSKVTIYNRLSKIEKKIRCSM